MSIAEVAAKLVEQSGDESRLARRSLQYMVMMREIEDRIERKLYRQGKIVGGVYVARGQEAIPVGVGLATEPEDVIFPSHRDLAVFLIRGVPPRRIFAQYMGRVDGLTRGRDGNMHMGDINLRVVAIISSIGAAVPVSAGAALALKYKGTRNVSVCFFGDGATSRGDVHEGINIAAVQKLPLVLICNNNQYAYSTPIEKQMAVANVADRAPGYGIPAEIVDGNDVFAVHEAARRAIAHARDGRGPYLLECKTFRMTGHSAHDPADYVPKELFAEWEAKDPIRRLLDRMLDAGWMGGDEVSRFYARIREEIDAAVEWAEASPWPDPATLLEGVYEQRA